LGETGIFVPFVLPSTLVGVVPKKENQRRGCRNRRALSAWRPEATGRGKHQKRYGAVRETKRKGNSRAPSCPSKGKRNIHHKNPLHA